MLPLFIQFIQFYISHIILCKLIYISYYIERSSSFYRSLVAWNNPLYGPSSEQQQSTWQPAEIYVFTAWLGI